MKFSAIATFALISTAEAWSGPAHLLTVRVARETLLQKDPTLIEYVDTILGYLKRSGECSEKVAKLIVEDQHPFVECTTFADNIKYHGGGFQSKWHFRDRAYLDKGGKLSDFTYKDATVHVTDAILGIRDWFNKENDYENNYYVAAIKRDQQCAKNEANAISTALRFLIHFIGDSHQPLHMVAKVDKEFPSGDKGGNEFKLKYHYESSNLHSVWDHVVYEFHKTLHVPFSDADWATNGEIAKQIMADNPESSVPNVSSTDPEVWAEESYNYAVQFVYQGTGESGSETKLTDAYIAKNRPIAHRRIAHGGYRLAYFLQSIDLKSAANLLNDSSSAESLFLQ